jgi:aspartate kinase
VLDASARTRFQAVPRFRGSRILHPCPRGWEELLSSLFPVSSFLLIMLIVHKYGGTSVGSPERIRAVAGRVAAARRAGNDVVVVVSAMGDSTDELIELAREVVGTEAAARRHPREMDMLLTSGERISMALLAMAIREHGVEALSMTGSQAAIITDESHTAARISEIRADRVREAVAEGKVVIVAGFQGVSRTREVTTLGRGGSDTTAVALAAALGAARCEIYTDVDGVFTADPRRVPEAKRVRELSHAEMIELAASGARVMHPRAVEVGARWGVDIRVLSSFTDPAQTSGSDAGTLITRTPRRMEGLVLTGIASRRGQAKLVMRGLPAGPAAPTRVLTALAEAGISLDMVSTAEDAERRTQLEVTIEDAAVERAREVCSEAARDLGASDEVQALGSLSRIALVGSGMHDLPGVYARCFRALLDGGIDVQAISSSSISITVLVGEDEEEAALRALHHAFELELQGATVPTSDPQVAPPA